MAAFDFPPTPAVGTLYPAVAEVGKPQYRWNGSEWVAATLDPAGYVRKSGDAMTGALSLAGDPTQALHAVPKQYLDAQKQRISLAGVKQVDVQVPTGAVAARLSCVMIPTTAASTTTVLQVSVASGVFLNTAGAYILYGMLHGTTSTGTAVSPSIAVNSIAGMLTSQSHTHGTLPALFDGMIGLTRPSTSYQFAADFRGVSYHATNGIMHTLYYNYIAPASGLSVLAFRLLATIGDNWADGSYLTVEWL